MVADDVSFEPVEALVHPVESCVDLCEARVDRVEAQMTRASNRSRAWMTHVAWRPTTPSRAATIVKTWSHSVLTVCTLRWLVLCQLRADNECVTLGQAAA